MSSMKTCANCKEPWVDGNKYCLFCGAPYKQVNYIRPDHPCIYGPPPAPPQKGLLRNLKTALRKLFGNNRFDPKLPAERPKTSIDHPFGMDESLFGGKNDK